MLLLMSSNPGKKKMITILLVSIVGLILGFLLLNNFTRLENSGDDTAIFTPYEGTLTGEYVCLPHKDTSGPQTMECAFGIRTTEGDYYAIDYGDNDIIDFNAGREATLYGRVTPIELLSTDHWRIYDVDGIITLPQQ